MVQADATLIEHGVAVLRRALRDRDRRAAPDHVEELRVLDDRLHAHEGEHFLVERYGALEVVDRELDVSDSVDFHVDTISDAVRVFRLHPSSESTPVAYSGQRRGELECAGYSLPSCCYGPSPATPPARRSTGNRGPTPCSSARRARTASCCST